MVKHVKLSDGEIKSIVTALETAQGNLRDDIADDPGSMDSLFETLGELMDIGHLLGRFAVIANHDKVPA